MPPQTPSSHQEVDTGEPPRSFAEVVKSNAYFREIMKLPTLHQNLMLDLRKYRISLYKYAGILSHHAIVISDGQNEDITLELTVDGEKTKIMKGMQEVIPRSVVFKEDKSGLIDKGVVECTLYELTDIATGILNSDPNYNWFSNNCQDFCKKFLDETISETYMTDKEKVIYTAAGASVSASSSSTLHVLTGKAINQLNKDSKV